MKEKIVAEALDRIFGETEIGGYDLEVIEEALTTAVNDAFDKGVMTGAGEIDGFDSADDVVKILDAVPGIDDKSSNTHTE